MSLPRLVRNSDDLARLVDEGYAVAIRHAHLVIDDIPFVTADAQIVRGSVVCPIDTNGDTTARPTTHMMWFTHIPHSKDGAVLDYLIHDRTPQQLAETIAVACSSSQKAHGRDYDNFYDKVVAYVGLIVGEAQALNPSVVPTTFKPVTSEEGASVFKYLDTNASRARFTALNDKLALSKVVIVGLGGTGAYILDLLAKTPIMDLHLYDGDVFSTHNAFRSPGAASIDDLNGASSKVAYYASRYEPLRWGIHAHPEYVNRGNVNEITDADYVFLAMDANPDKKVIIEALMTAGVPFADTGIGVRNDPTGLAGLLRITSAPSGAYEHIDRGGLISYDVGDGAEYEANIQVAELNALAATLSVIAFKKRYGFYSDVENELHTLYRIDSNELLNAYGESDEPPANEGEA